MDIYMIWASEIEPNGVRSCWLIDAWDDDSVSGNREGWKQAVDKAQAEHGYDNVRIVKGSVDMDAVRNAFEIPRADLNVDS